MVKTLVVGINWFFIHIDIHAATHCIADLLLGEKSGSKPRRIGIVANRVKTNTRGSKRLENFLKNFDIPVVTTLRDSVNYSRSAEMGLGISEMPRWQVPTVGPYLRPFSAHFC